MHVQHGAVVPRAEQREAVSVSTGTRSAVAEYGPLGALRWVWGGAVVIALLAGYALIARWNLHRFSEGISGRDLLSRWDRSVPAVPWTIWLYMLYFPLVVTPLLVVRDRVQLLQVVVAFGLVSVTAWTTFLLMPSRMVYPDLTCTGISCSMLEHLYSVDRGVNIFPSLHAAHSVLAAAIFCEFRSRLAGLVILGASLVCLAAVLTRQHYLVDMPAGILLGLGAWAATQRLAPWLERAAERCGLLNRRA